MRRRSSLKTDIGALIPRLSSSCALAEISRSRSRWPSGGQRSSRASCRQTLGQALALRRSPHSGCPSSLRQDRPLPPASLLAGPLGLRRPPLSAFALCPPPLFDLDSLHLGRICPLSPRPSPVRTLRARLSSINEHTLSGRQCWASAGPPRAERPSTLQRREQGRRQLTEGPDHRARRGNSRRDSGRGRPLAPPAGAPRARPTTRRASRPRPPGPPSPPQATGRRGPPGRRRRMPATKVQIGRLARVAGVTGRSARVGGGGA